MRIIHFCILFASLGSITSALEQEKQLQAQEVPLLIQHPEVIKRLDQISQQLEAIKDIGLQSLQELKKQSNQLEQISKTTVEIQEESKQATKTVRKIEKIVKPGCVLF